MRNREKVIQVRLTEKEKAAIIRKAKKCNLSVSGYLRELALGHKPKEYPKELWSLCWDIEMLKDQMQDNEKYYEYLKSFLQDMRKFLYWKDGGLEGSPQSLLCGEKEHPRSDKPFGIPAESEERSVM